MSKVYVFTRYGGPDTQQLIERPVPEPRPGELLIAVRAAGVNPADWKIRAGYLGSTQPPPVPMGLEVSGVVTALGEGVTGFSVGDEVLGSVARDYGGFAEHTLVAAEAAVAKPEEISFADAATIPVAGATAYDITHQIELDAGQTMLIVGIGGGVGLMAAQIGSVHEFHVLGTGSAAKQDIVDSTGATLVPYGPDLAARIEKVGVDGVDLIVDLVGGDALREVAHLAKDPSRIISAADRTTVTDLGGSPLNRTTDALSKVTEVIEYGLVDPHVSALYPLDRAGEGVAEVEGGHATGKIVIEIIGSRTSGF
ncbi:MAG TPA: NADP-dependent oxidoreductase [Jiangellaceae bacterium]|nr:NADP-dependent oxidoreductase [Jiangellaceae bacterium]